MNDVSFHEDVEPRANAAAQAEQSTLVQLVRRWGIASTEKDANLVIIVVAIVLIATAIGIYAMSLKEPELPPPIISAPQGT